MFDHVTIRVTDRKASERFYETVFAPLAIAQTYSDETLAEWDEFSLSPATPDKPATRGLHAAFVAPSRAIGTSSGAPGPRDAFHAAATGASYRDNGAPGERPEYHPGYYGAFVLDPDGNNVEVVSHNR